jgi:hypothetical protein
MHFGQTIFAAWQALKGISIKNMDIKLGMYSRGNRFMDFLDIQCLTTGWIGKRILRPKK